MFQISHNLHLVVDLLIQDTIFHEAPLVKLFRRIDCAMLLGGQLVDRSESAFSNLPGHVVYRAARPMHAVRVGDGP